MLWYSLEAPQQGASNEYPQHMFSSRNKKNIMWIPSLICSYGKEGEENVQTIFFSNLQELIFLVNFHSRKINRLYA